MAEGARDRACSAFKPRKDSDLMLNALSKLSLLFLKQESNNLINV